MRIRIPTQLQNYTGERAEVTGDGETLGAVLADLDRRFPGIRFRVVDEQQRIRPHIKVFVDRALARSLDHPTADADELMIVGALSGG